LQPDAEELLDLLRSSLKESQLLCLKAKECSVRLSTEVDQLWCAMAGGLLIGLQEHIGVVREALAIQPSMQVPPEIQIQSEGSTDYGQDPQA
jgi:hypothetical protein